MIIAAGVSPPVVLRSQIYAALHPRDRSQVDAELRVRIEATAVTDTAAVAAASDSDSNRNVSKRDRDKTTSEEPIRDNTGAIRPVYMDGSSNTVAYIR